MLTLIDVERVDGPGVRPVAEVLVTGVDAEVAEAIGRAAERNHISGFILASELAVRSECEAADLKVAAPDIPGVGDPYVGREFRQASVEVGVDVAEEGRRQRPEA